MIIFNVFAAFSQGFSIAEREKKINFAPSIDVCMKILYVVGSLVPCGGVERILSDKASYLSQREGYEVTIVACTQSPGQANAFCLADSVRQVNLSIPYNKQYRYRYPWRLWVKWQLNRMLRRELTLVVRRVNPDVIVGLSHFHADVVCSIKCRARKVIESHEARPFTLSGLAEHRNFFSAVYMRHFRRVYFSVIERKADVVVALTEGDAGEWRKARRVEVIPNFTPLSDCQRADMSAKRVIAVGRMSWEKGFDRMINIWAKVEEGHPGWQLVIFGQGDLEEKIKADIARLGLKNAKIVPFNSEIGNEYARSSLCLLTSHYEGFGLVLVEAFCHGIPCVAFDCPFGPASIIENGRNGYLIKNGDVKDFALKLGQLMEDDGLRHQFSDAALERARMFSSTVVMEKWTELLDSLVIT